MRLTRSGVGTFPLRKPGMRTVAARSFAACSTAWWTSCAGTWTVSLTLSSPTFSTTFGIAGPLDHAATFLGRGATTGHPQTADAQAIRFAPGRRGDGAETGRPGALRAESPPDAAVAFPDPRARDAGRARGGRRKQGGDQAAAGRAITHTAYGRVRVTANLTPCAWFLLRACSYLLVAVEPAVACDVHD